MNNIKHSLSIGTERIENKLFLSIKIIGKLTHEDYLKIIPLIESTLLSVEQPEIDVFVDASELDGWELRAAWDDFRLGLKYGKEFKKIAIYGHKKWQQYLIKISAWFISGEVYYFSNAKEAYLWLKE